ncbi:hypothetical protein GMD78_04145 [Ornithinibacillus sp. L9]|uniref:Uncharacterized protein n=1 Tax=Ornithinibacillus caprae TaxID=2678566 RepID=A0A6N8FEH3_9BACI|nr:hypothetical protein [Ornithinibacillus caprae]MUK87591.1 hypothetical protein [Ornithinibacillus caprae]
MDSNADLIQLKQLYTELLDITERHGKGEIDYQIQEIKNVINIIHGTIINGDKDSEEVLQKVRKINRNIYPPRGGLTDFFIWSNDVDQRIKLNEPLSNIGNKIWEILN